MHIWIGEITLYIDCVFSGGGVKAYSFIGALQSIYETNHRIERVAGTSAGAIFAAFIAAGYTTREIENMLDELNVQQLLDPPLLSKYIPFMKWILLYHYKGLYKGDKLEKWLEEKLASKGIVTFSQLKRDYLKVIVSDISLGKLIVIPDDLERVYGIEPAQFKVATAVRMSASFPYFIMPKTIQYNNHTSYIVDGGLLSNFPLWVLNEGHRMKRPVLGLSLSNRIENIKPMRVRNAIDMFQALFSAMLRAHDSRYISKTKQNDIVFIPVEEISSLEVSISNEEKNHLIHLGKMKTDHFLKRWSK